jgi:hypothetical protein
MDFKRKNESRRSILWQSLVVDSRSIRVFQIAIAIAILLDVWERYNDIDVLYTDYGICPRSVLVHNRAPKYLYSIYFANGYRFWSTLLCIVNGAAAIGMIVDVPGSTLVCWFMAIQIQMRNPYVASGGDIVHRVMLFFLILAPKGTLPSFYNRPRKKNNGLHSLTALAPVCQLLIIYFCAHAHKTGYSWRMSGDASREALENIYYFRTRFGDLLLNSSIWFMRASTFAVLKWQFYGALLWLTPNQGAKLISFLGFFTMHFSFGISMNLGHFTYIMLACTILLAPGYFWDLLQIMENTKSRLKEKRNQRRNERNGRNGRNEKKRKRYFQLNTVAKNCVCLLGLIAVVSWNLKTFLKDSDDKVNDSWDFAMHVVGLDQAWSMFSPGPPKRDWFPVIVGNLTNGTMVDVFKGMFDHKEYTVSPNIWNEFPDRISYRNLRVYKALSFVFNRNYHQTTQTTIWTIFGQYVCKQFNHDKLQLKEFSMSKVSAVNRFKTKTTLFSRKMLWIHTC